MRYAAGCFREFMDLVKVAHDRIPEWQASRSRGRWTDTPPVGAEPVQVVMDSAGVITVNVVSYYACANNELRMTTPIEKSWPLPANCAGGPGPGPSEDVGAFPAGTLITLEFVSGFPGGSASSCTSGSFPNWRFDFEDGGGGTCDDARVDLSVGPAVDPDCPELPEFKDSGLVTLTTIWHASNPHSPVEQRMEHAGWLIQQGDSLERSYEIQEWQGSFASQCVVRPLASDTLEPANTLALVHTHPLPAGGYSNLCARDTFNVVDIGTTVGISSGDTTLVQHFGKIYILDHNGITTVKPGIIIEEFPGCITN